MNEERGGVPKGVAAVAVMTDGVQVRVLVGSTSGRGAPISTTRSPPTSTAQLGLLIMQAVQAGSAPPGLETPESGTGPARCCLLSSPRRPQEAWGRAPCEVGIPQGKTRAPYAASLTKLGLMMYWMYWLQTTTRFDRLETTNQGTA